MKTRMEIEADVARLAETDYYGEDFEIVSRARAYAGSLSPVERELLACVVAERLRGGGTLVDILLAGVMPSPAAVERLIAQLDAVERVSAESRALLDALRAAGDPTAFPSVERFLDSEQEHEALRVLAALDFERALPLLFRRLGRDHLLDLAVRLIRDRLRSVGVEALASALGAAAGAAALSSETRNRLAAALRSSTSTAACKASDLERLAASVS